MQRDRSPNRSWLRYALIAFLTILVVLSAIFIFFDRVAAFYVNRFTDYRFAYDKWGAGPFDRSDIENARIALKGSEAGIRAREIHFDFDIYRWLAEREIALSCQMKDVFFEVKGENVPRLFPADSVLAKPFGPDQKYDRIEFRFFSDKKETRLSNFRARSDDIKVTGDYTFLKEKDEVSVDFKISFSPEFSSSFDENIRENVLSVDEDGWYSTIINYKGNALLLKALYSFTIAP